MTVVAIEPRGFGVAPFDIGNNTNHRSSSVFNTGLGPMIDQVSNRLSFIPGFFMARFFTTIVLILIVLLGSWALFNRDRINNASDFVTLAKESFDTIPIPELGIFQANSDDQLTRRPNPVFERNRESIRIATFRLNGKTAAAQQPDALRLMTEIGSRFDVLAIQDAAQIETNWLQNLMAELAQKTGTQYGFINSPFHDGRQYVTIFNQSKVQLDHQHYYSVNDPDGLFEKPALVGWFRCTGTAESQAFTFSLANLQLSEVNTGDEILHLSALYRSIRQDGRNEDDVIIAGDFQAGEHGLSIVKEQSGLHSVAANMPTNLYRTAQFDNMLFSPNATVEYSGEAGVFDFMQHFNLFLDDAIDISRHLPVWADFSIYEGHQPSPLGQKDRVAKK